jgi:beta-glucosidase
MKNTNRKKIWLAVWCLFLAACICFNVWATNYALSWDKALSDYFGYIGGTENTSEKYSSVDELREAERALALQIVDEGAVLLKNDNNALPLTQGSKVSVFGQTAQMWMTKEKLSNTKDTVFLESLQEAGLEVNNELRKMYKQSKHTKWGTGANLGDGGIAGTWAIDEVPVSEFSDAAKQSYANFPDAAIVVFTRGGSEGGDLPRDMERFGGEAGQGYLELTQTERDLLTEVTANFEKVVVILHTTNAMQLDFLKDYDIDAVLWISGTGEDGVQEMGKILTGAVNPSGKNVDTYVYDNLSAPAMQNFGDFRFTQNGELITNTTSSTGGTYSYLNYAEGIYVGYRYYETRYEDVVMGTENAGEYDYKNTVAYPFGYGLSYTSFQFSDFKASSPDKSGEMTLSIKVTNTGSVAGKQVAEFYYQSPYTVYDKANGVEKASVNLIQFGKTGILEPGASETITVTVNVNDFVSYDAKNAKTYILEAGDYYITAAGDAHEAVNNILAAKGYADGMTANGDKALTTVYTVKSTEMHSTSSTGYTVTNQFDDCLFPNAVYLSRSNWNVLENGGIRTADGCVTGASNTTDAAGTAYTIEATAEIISGLTSEGWDTSGNPIAIDDASWPAVTYGASNGLKLADMVGVAYDDPKWDKLLDQMSQEDQINLVGKSGWGTDAVASVGKAQTYYLDGPQGMIDYISGGAGYQFADENVLGATWNQELAREMGDLCGQEFAIKGASIWWSPAINLHRTAYSGRNFEYFSEDGVFSGLMGTQWVKAAQANGVVAQLKHFFLNDQETNRGANGRLATFANEQTMREIYLKPFQMCIEDGGAMGTMNTMCRIGTVCSPSRYSANVNILRNEWGMTGAIITDAQSFNEREAEQALAAGCDMVCATAKTSYSSSTLASPGGQYMLRQGAKNILYITANGFAADSDFSKGYPIYRIALVVYNVLTFIYLAWFTLEVISAVTKKQILPKKVMRVIRIVLGTLGILILLFLLYKFFTEWLPMLKFALQTAV